MPFQAVPIAFRANTGSPLSKLLFIYLVNHADIEDSPNGQGIFIGEVRYIAEFVQADESEINDALALLKRLGLIGHFSVIDDPVDNRIMVDLMLPLSQLGDDERKRIKASPDQLEEMVSRQKYHCATCGEYNYELSGWHADHIIPRSVGGADVELNLQAICERCNTRKGNRVHWVDFLGVR